MMSSFMDKLFSAGASNIVNAVGDAIDKNRTTDEKQENEQEQARADYATQMQKFDVEEDKNITEDIKDARSNQTKIQGSEYAGWLSKNIHPILALLTVGATFFLYYYIMTIPTEYISQTTKELILFILGGLTAMCTQVYSYFFGSSAKGHDQPTMKL